MEVTTDAQHLRHCPHPAEHAKKREGQAEEGKEGEHCRRRGLVQERQAQEHHQPEVEPILCNCSVSADYREAV